MCYSPSEARCDGRGGALGVEEGRTPINRENYSWDLFSLLPFLMYFCLSVYPAPLHLSFFTGFSFFDPCQRIVRCVPLVVQVHLGDSTCFARKPSGCTLALSLSSQGFSWCKSSVKKFASRLWYFFFKIFPSKFVLLSKNQKWNEFTSVVWYSQMKICLFSIYFAPIGCT